MLFRLFHHLQSCSTSHHRSFQQCSISHLKFLVEHNCKFQIACERFLLKNFSWNQLSLDILRNEGHLSINLLHLKSQIIYWSIWKIPSIDDYRTYLQGWKWQINGTNLQGWKWQTNESLISSRHHLIEEITLLDNIFRHQDWIALSLCYFKSFLLYFLEDYSFFVKLNRNY